MRIKRTRGGRISRGPFAANSDNFERVQIGLVNSAGLSGYFEHVQRRRRPGHPAAIPQRGAPAARSSRRRWRCFRERGFEQTTMRDIAGRAGVSLGAAYYYFASKEAIVGGLLRLRPGSEHQAACREAFAARRTCATAARGAAHARSTSWPAIASCCGRCSATAAIPTTRCRGSARRRGEQRELSIGSLRRGAARRTAARRCARVRRRRCCGPCTWACCSSSSMTTPPDQRRTRRLIDAAVDLRRRHAPHRHLAAAAAAAPPRDRACSATPVCCPPPRRRQRREAAMPSAWPAWLVMWTLAGGVYGACKVLTWRGAADAGHGADLVATRRLSPGAGRGWMRRRFSRRPPSAGPPFESGARPQAGRRSARG